MKKALLSAAILAVMSTPAVASAVKVVGTLPVVVDTSIHRQARSLDSLRQLPPKIVSLMKIELSPSAQKHLKNRMHKVMNKPSHLTTNHSQSLPNSYQVGMNNVPVLDQGYHGSCVTFANTGAVDAGLGQGDYASQLCSLSLGKYLASQDHSYPSGWDGSWGPIVLKQLFEYGIVSMENQHQNGCGGLTDYPTHSYSTGGQTTTSEYATMSESIKSSLSWTPIFFTDEIATNDSDSDAHLEAVKEALAKGQRVTFGVLLDVYYGSNGAVGSYHKHNDTWMLTDAIQKDLEDGYINAGHEMIITGYDDDATVTAPDGTVNKGLLTLRNSWGKFAGDNGNYYMSYDHFKALALEAQVLKVNS